MKIALVVPPVCGMGGPIHIPLGLIFLSATIRGKHKISIIDLNFPNEYDKLKRKRFDLIGFTCLSCHRDFVVKASKEIKRDYNPIIVVGGHHASLAAEDLIEQKSIDYVIRGAGDISFPQLINAIDRKRSLSNIEGLCYRKNKNNYIRDIGFVSDLDRLSLPSYGSLNLEKYLKKNGGSILYEASRGCVHKCRFCTLWKACKGKFAVVSKTKIFSDLRKILAFSKNITEIRFIDNTFNYNRRRVLDVCEVMRSLRRLVKREVNWTALIRPDKIDEKMVKEMKNSGLTSVFIGFESGNSNSLRYLRRPHKIKEICYIIDLFIRYKIITRVSFQIGFPWETKDEMRKTVDTAINIAKRATVTALYKFTPYPGIDIDVSSLTKKQGSSYKFVCFPIGRTMRLAFEHPLVSNSEVKETISSYRRATSYLHFLSEFSKIKD
ncbi:B12-binding domain-containing radical SAM protein [Candidatus Omnitrophota bacterium]